MLAQNQFNVKGQHDNIIVHLNNIVAITFGNTIHYWSTTILTLFREVLLQTLQ